MSTGGGDRAPDADDGREGPGGWRDDDDDRQPVDDGRQPVGDGGWRPVDDGSERGGSRHVSGEAAPAAGVLLREFMQSPEGEVQEGSLVVRPSMRAALGRVLTAFLVITPFFLPVAISTAWDGFGGGPDAGPRAGSVMLFIFDVAGNLIIPFLVSLAPAVQLAFTRYVLDGEGIRERVQLLSRSDKRVRWDKVTALQHRRSVLDRILGIERIDVVAYGRRGTTLHLIGLRAAPHIRDLVAQQMRANASVTGMLRND